MNGPHRIGFLGCGNMGGAILEGMLENGLYQPHEILVVEQSPERREQWRERGVEISARARDLGGSGTILLAVKPQSFPDAAAELGALGESTMVLSVMAGIHSLTIAGLLGDSARVVRSMPNTPCAIGMGISAVARGSGAAETDVREAIRLLQTVGQVVEVEESDMHAVTATSGSGPAYLFLLAEAWIDAAVDHGLDPDVARQLVVSTMHGSAELLRRGGDPETLRGTVTSKEGTTAAGIARLELLGTREMMREAIRAACARSEELGSS